MLVQRNGQVPNDLRLTRRPSDSVGRPSPLQGVLASWGRLLKSDVLVVETFPEFCLSRLEELVILATYGRRCRLLPNPSSLFGTFTLKFVPLRPSVRFLSAKPELIDVCLAPPQVGQNCWDCIPSLSMLRCLDLRNTTWCAGECPALKFERLVGSAARRSPDTNVNEVKGHLRRRRLALVDGSCGRS